MQALVQKHACTAVNLLFWSGSDLQCSSIREAEPPWCSACRLVDALQVLRGLCLSLAPTQEDDACHGRGYAPATEPV